MQGNRLVCLECVISFIDVISSPYQLQFCCVSEFYVLLLTI